MSSWLSREIVWCGTGSATPYCLARFRDLGDGMSDITEIQQPGRPRFRATWWISTIIIVLGIALFWWFHVQSSFKPGDTVLLDSGHEEVAVASSPAAIDAMHQAYKDRSFIQAQRLTDSHAVFYEPANTSCTVLEVDDHRDALRVRLNGGSHAGREVYVQQDFVRKP
jgi:hypothetical protein